MKVLIDECLPRKPKFELPDHLVRTVPEAGWASMRNGELLRLAQAEFEVFLTTDPNIEYQQNLKQFDLAVIVLVAPTNDIDDLRPLMRRVNDLLNEIQPGEIRSVR